MPLPTFEEARRQALCLSLAGWMAGLFCLMQLGVAGLKGIYVLSLTAATRGEQGITAPFRHAIEVLYAIPARVAPDITAFVWGAAPELNLRGTLLSLDNAGFFAIYAVLLLSIWARVRAFRLRRPMAEHEHWRQQLHWEKTARAKLRSGGARSELGQEASTRASTENEKLPWHTTLVGVVVLGIALPLIVDVVKILVGLAKLP